MNARAPNSPTEQAVFIAIMIVSRCTQREGVSIKDIRLHKEAFAL